MSHPFDLTLSRFPVGIPAMESIADDPEFTPARHLALEEPENRLTLADLGYGEEIAASTPTPIAATSCFRLLSEEGVAALYHVCKQLEAFTTSNPRIDRNTRGGVYRSRFLRDLSLSVDVSEHLSRVLETRLLPHAMGHQLAHLNFQPMVTGRNVDKWHYDTLQVDYVMFVTDPKEVEGGEFQYFLGTRDEMRRLRDAGDPIPAERIVVPDMPGAGHAVLMQGNYVVHQAKALRAPGERITLVNGYSFADRNVPDYTAWKQLLYADPAGIVVAEYTRQMALRCADRLQCCINRPDFSTDIASHLAVLSGARHELDVIIAQLQDESESGLEHFGD